MDSASRMNDQAEIDAQGLARLDCHRLLAAAHGHDTPVVNTGN